MISQRFNDIRLDEHDLEEIEQEVEEHNRRVYNGEMPARAKSVMREMLKREMKEGIWSNRDYSEADAGEAPKGSNW